MDIITLLQRTTLNVLLALPRPIRRLIAGPPREHDGQVLDLNAQLLGRLDQLLGGAETSRAAMRRGALSVAGPQIAVGHVRQESVAGAAGRLPARRYIPAASQSGGPGPLMVYYHGGGWVVGDLDTHDAVCRALANATGAPVISVDYRLAPEHPFPAPVDDAVAAYLDIVARASEFGADPQKIVVAGDSAGGHLATTVAQRVLAAGDQLPAAQVLIYPGTDFVETYQSERDFAEGLALTKAEMDAFTAAFLPSDAFRADASPLRAATLSGLPPALVLTAGFDPLRDEGEAYATAMVEAGVDVVLRRYPAQIHGFLNMLGVTPDAHQAIGEIAGVLSIWLAQDRVAATTTR